MDQTIFCENLKKFRLSKTLYTGTGSQPSERKCTDCFEMGMRNNFAGRFDSSCFSKALRGNSR